MSEIVGIIFIIIGFILLIHVCSQWAICPITNKKDFKHNMYKHVFSHYAPHGPTSHVGWYTKEGYEKRFNCKIVKCETNTTGWKAIPKKEK